MATQKLSNQRIHEVQQVLASYVPKLPGTDVNLLAALCKAVLTSVDLRDIRRVASAELVEQLEQVLSTIKTRGRGEINSVVRRHDDGDGAGPGHHDGWSPQRDLGRELDGPQARHR